MDKEELKKKFKQISELAAYLVANIEGPIRIKATASSIMTVCEQEIKKLS